MSARVPQDPERRRAPIGLWDSGIGGLTVMRALLESVPHERLVYFGDTARVPYGSKSPETITRFAIENTLFLLRHDIKFLVVACNTASAVALDTLRKRFTLPIVGMIESGAAAAVQASASGRIGVIGTVGTVASGSYTRAITTLRPDAQVTSAACPLFVPLAEEGVTEHDAVRLIAREYLAPIADARVDTVILGCTHYPLLARVIGEVLGPHVQLVDSGRAAAREVTELLGWKDLRRAPDATDAPAHRVYVSDRGPQFQRVAERFLGRAVGDVSVIEQTDLPWYEKEIA